MPVVGTFERRYAGELRAAGRQLQGYAATFGVEAKIGGFTEIIAPGAFAESLRAGSDILALADHNPRAVLARTKSGTLKLSEDARGLAFAIDLPDTSIGRDVLALAERGDLGGMSFGFTVRKGGERWAGTRRELRSIDLREISVVSAWPAYENTEVHARSQAPEGLIMLRRFLEIVR